MDAEKFKAIYAESRNGCDHFVRHPLVRSFIYSDGVADLAETGMYWLLDIAATELLNVVRRGGALCVLRAKVRGGSAALTAELQDDAPPAWKRDIHWTDMPEGEWKFFLNCDDGQHVSMILPSEY